MHVKDLFNSVASKAARGAGSLGAFVAALAVILIWVVAGPIFGFNDTWQLVINTGITIITYLMVFLIQHTQNADSAALQIKLDELIRATTDANNELLNLEEMDDDKLEEIRQPYEALAKTAAMAQQKKGKCAPSQPAFED